MTFDAIDNLSSGMTVTSELKTFMVTEMVFNFGFILL